MALDHPIPERFAALARENRHREAADLEAREPLEHYARGLARAEIGRDGEARADFEAARALGERAAIELAFLDVRERRDLGGALAEAGRIARDEVHGTEVRARAFHVLGLAAGKLRETRTATDALMLAERLYRELGDRRGRARVLDTLGAFKASLGRLDLAASDFMSSLVHKAMIGDQLGMALTLGQIGRAHLRAGRTDEALECFELDLGIARELGDIRGEVRMLEDLGRARLERDELDAARACLEEAAGTAAGHGFADLEFFARLDLGRALARSGRSAEAETELAKAGARQSNGGEPYHAVLLASALGEVRWHARDKSCLKLLTEAKDHADKLEVPDLEIQVLLLLAEAKLHWNKERAVRSAEVHVLRALELATAEGLSRFLPAVHQAMLRLALPLGAGDNSRDIDWTTLADGPANPTGPLHGGFIFLERLGSGAFGTTWRAYDARRHRIVAVKRLHIEELYDAADRQFVLLGARSELITASRIHHPGVARVLEIGDDTRGGTYVVQEFVAGPTLRKIMHSAPRGQPEIALPVIADLARALEALHARHTIHRDLKPENVILRRAQPPKEPVLIDFGLAQRLDLALEQDALTIAGTAGYMAPEQARGTDVGPAADVHALGVILYEWLAGVRPYELDGEPPTTFGRIAAWLERARPKPLASVAQGVPPAVADLTRRMLERKPALRPAPSEIAAVCDRACSKPTASS